MATVTPVPFAVGLVVGIALFVAMTYFLIEESRKPVEHWRHQPVPVGPRVSHTRVATICVLFMCWSLWVTARPVSGWR